MSSSSHGRPVLSKEDYYARSIEFKLYLLEYHAKYLHDLPSDEARHLFKKKFVKKWNAQELPEKYYCEEYMSELAPSQLSSHQWKIKRPAHALESQNLRQKVADQTAGKPAPPNTTPSAPCVAKVIGPTMPPPNVARQSLDTRRLAEDAKIEEREQRKKYERYLLKRNREDRELLLDEVAPKKEGHAAMVEKRRQAHQRSGSPEGAEMSERDLYGSSGDYERRLLAEREKQRLRDEEKIRKTREKQLVLQDKVQAYQDKESKLMEMFKQMAQSRAQKQ